MKQKLSNYIAEKLLASGITDVFMITGGGAMHLDDALGHQEGLHCLYNHHEQACAMAAEAYARIHNKIAAVCVTTGPGGINAMNGVVEDRNYFVQRILASFYTILLLIVLLLSLVFMVFGTTLVRLLNDRIPILDHLMSIAMHFKPLFSWGILTLVFMVIYAYVPNVKLKLTKQFPGALFTAISWNLFSWGFSAYIERFNDFGVYGSLSTIIVVMMWLYFCMYLLLVGAHINRFAVPFRREILEK